MALRENVYQAIIDKLADPGDDEPSFMAGMKKHGAKLNVLMKESQLQVAQVEALPALGSDDNGSAEQLLEAKSLCDDILSVITMQSLLCLLRSPNVRKADSTEQKWLRDVLESYAVAGSRLTAVPKHLDEADLLLGTSVAAQYAVRRPAVVEGEDAVAPEQALVELSNTPPVAPAVAVVAMSSSSADAVNPASAKAKAKRHRRTRAEIAQDRERSAQAAPKQRAAKRARKVSPLVEEQTASPLVRSQTARDDARDAGAAVATASDDARDAAAAVASDDARDVVAEENVEAVAD